MCSFLSQGSTSSYQPIMHPCVRSTFFSFSFYFPLGELLCPLDDLHSLWCFFYMEQNTHTQTKQGPFLQSRKHFTDVFNLERVQPSKQINNPWLKLPKTWKAQILSGKPGRAGPASFLSARVAPRERFQLCLETLFGISTDVWLWVGTGNISTRKTWQWYFFDMCMVYRINCE